ncbi:MAG: rhodanese-like domain-containing protein [Dehalococcoidia bacterium]
MVTFVEAFWLEDERNSSSVQLVDPRRPVKYLQGHLRKAVNVPASAAFDADGRLRPEEQLAEWLGRSGVRSGAPVVLYDSYDGQDGAMMAWLLEYLGHPDVRFLRTSFDQWTAEGRERFYRPVKAEAATFECSVRHELRASWRDLAIDEPPDLLDVRSEEEYAGKDDSVERAGHIPGAKNIPWIRFVSKKGDLFTIDGEGRTMLRNAGFTPERKAVVYCRRGPRAAVALLSMQQRGYDVTLYDGSFADWAAHADLPVEV